MRGSTGIWIAVLTVLVAAPSPSTAQTAGPKIDVHLHPFPAAAPDGVRPLGYPCPNDRVECNSPPPRYTTDDAVMAGTIEQMQRHQIVLGALMGGSLQGRWLDAAPSLFLRGASFHPVRLRPATDTLRQRIQRGTVDFLGEIAPQYSGVAANDTVLDPYFAVAAEADIPVLIHMEGIGARFPGFRAALGRPLMLEEVLTRHPGLRLYVENAGYPFIEDMIAVLYMYPNVYVDLSTITWIIPRTAFHDYLERLVRAGFADRLMFGSDQMSWPETIDLAVEAIDSAPFLTDQQKRDIFFNNAVRFFRLDPEDLLAPSPRRPAILLSSALGSQPHGTAWKGSP